MWLTMDASGPVTVLGVVGPDGVTEVVDDAAEGRPGRLASLVAGLMAGRGVTAVAVVVGPGSFTGLRASIALARGISDAGGLPCVGVTVGEVLGCPVALAAGTGRFVVERGAPGSVFDLVGAVPAGVALAGRCAPGPVARAAARRRSGEWPARALLPVYATPPAAIAGVVRPAPV